MIITGTNIRELKDIYVKQKMLAEAISNMKKTYQDRNGKNLISLERDGKKINLDENTLWVEVFNGGVECQAGTILAEKYPELFAKFKEHTVAVERLNLFTAKTWGFFFSQMSLVILIDLVLALIKYQLNPINWFRK